MAIIPHLLRTRSLQGATTLLIVLAIITALAELQTTSASVESPEAVAFEGTFRDDDSSIHEHNIEFLVQRGIALGCGSDRFCPSSEVTREQMSAFLYQTAVYLYGPSHTDPHPPNSGNLGNTEEHVTRASAAEMILARFHHLSALPEPQRLFADMASQPEAIERAVEGLHRTGVVQGCATAPLRFCPQEKITRAQMASLLARALQTNEPTVGLILNEPESEKGYVLFTNQDHPPVYLINNLGQKIQVWTSDYNCFLPKLLDNGNVMCLVDTRSPSGRIVEIDQQNTIVWEYDIPYIHHDFLKLPNNNVLMLSSYWKSPEESIAAGANPDCVPSDGRGVRVDYVLEVKPTGLHSGEVVWEWHVWDHLIQDLDPNKLNYGKISQHPELIDINYIICSAPWRGSGRDLTHINSISFNPDLNQIMLSPRNYSELWVIDHGTNTEQAAGKEGDILYRWGNPQAHGAGNSDDQQLFRQHTPHWIPSGLPGAGNILIYNNGAGTVNEISPPLSQLVDDSGYRLHPDQAGEPVWTHTVENPASFKSAAQRLPNGNTFITTSYLGTFSQVTPDMRVVWKYISPATTEGLVFQGEQTSIDHNSNGTYRATWYPHDHPGLRGLDLTPEGPLELSR